MKQERNVYFTFATLLWLVQQKEMPKEPLYIVFRDAYIYRIIALPTIESGIYNKQIEVLFAPNERNQRRGLYEAKNAHLYDVLVSLTGG